MNIKPVSKYLQNFIKKEFRPIKTMFSRTSKQFLENIFKNIKDSQNELKKATINKTRIDFTKDKLPEQVCLSEQIREICDLIKNNEKIGNTYTFTVGGREVAIWLIYPFAKDDPKHLVSRDQADEYFKRCVERIYMWLYVASKYAQAQCSPKLNLYLYFTNHFKLLPKNRDAPIGQLHVNTAFTYAMCAPSNDIHLFREEEWFKVLIHESFHNLLLDFGGKESDTTKANANILDMFSVKSKVNLFETYCEMWAEIINTMFMTVLENPDQLFKRFEEHLKYEQTFSAFQAAKVLHFFGLTHDELCNKTQQNRYKEESNILSYYILKSIAMTNVNEYVEWCIQNNVDEKGQGSLNFLKTNENIFRYSQFFREHYQSPPYLQEIEKMEEWFSKQMPNNMSLENQTMRMTVFELA